MVNTTLHRRSAYRYITKCQQLLLISARSELFSALSAAYKYTAELSRVIERSLKAPRYQIWL